ncbi:MAG: WG repeat-containing protein [Bacteroidales bacterium]|nr:WG repeat-containing protein [Bacteroidales bacterium]
MNKKTKIIIGAATWTIILAIAASALIASCSQDNSVSEDASDSGMLLNDDLVAIKESDGNITIKNTETGEVTAEKIKFDWTSSSPNDSLGVFCSKGKRGYYNSYTGKIVVEAQYRRAWIFSEGLAAVQKNGHIGFINRKGETVIPFRFPYHGNPLSEFVFKDGHCVVADTTGKCGVINRKGEWLIKPLYDDISTYEDHAIVSKAGARMQVSYDGRVLNSFVLDDIEALTYSEQERFENREGEIEYISKTIKTGLFAYRVGGRWGLMDSNCNRLTEPLYSKIVAVDKNMFRATLLDRYSEVILNSRGTVMR